MIGISSVLASLYNGKSAIVEREAGFWRHTSFGEVCFPRCARFRACVTQFCLQMCIFLGDYVRVGSHSQSAKWGLEDVEFFTRVLMNEVLFCAGGGCSSLSDYRRVV
jgi:hypothetical protein